LKKKKKKKKKKDKARVSVSCAKRAVACAHGLAICLRQGRCSSKPLAGPIQVVVNRALCVDALVQAVWSVAECKPGGIPTAIRALGLHRLFTASARHRSKARRPT
jgi:hypothetical protein